MKHKNNTLGPNLEKFWPTTSPSDAHPKSNEEGQNPTQIHRCWQHRNTTAPQLSPEPQICVLHYLTAREHPLTSQNLGGEILWKAKAPGRFHLARVIELLFPVFPILRVFRTCLAVKAPFLQCSISQISVWFSTSIFNPHSALPQEQTACGSNHHDLDPERSQTTLILEAVLGELAALEKHTP